MAISHLQTRGATVYRAARVQSKLMMKLHVRMQYNKHTGGMIVVAIFDQTIAFGL